MSFMPEVGSTVRLKTGEIGVVVKVTPDGKDDRVEVIREFWGDPRKKQVRVDAWMITEVITEVEGR